MYVQMLDKYIENIKKIENIKNIENITIFSNPGTMIQVCCSCR